MGWDPIGDIKRTAERVVNTVTETVNNATDSIARSDIGKGLGATTAPLAAARDATVQALQGNLGQAATTLAGGHLESNPITMAINSSSSVRDLFQTKEFGNITLGLSSDAVNASDAYRSLKNNGQLTPSELKDILVYNAKGAAIGSGLAYAGSAGYLSKAASFAAEKPAEALIFAKLASQGNYKEIVNSFAPGIGDIIPPPASNRPTPVSSPGVIGPAIDSYTVNGLDTKTKIALGVALFFVAALFFRKRGT